MGAFERSNVSFDQADALVIERACVQFLNDYTGKIGLENQRKESILKECRAILGAEGKKIDIRV